MWGLQTDKSVMTQQREMWPPEKHKTGEYRGIQLSPQWSERLPAGDLS